MCETGVASGPACLQWTDRPKDGYIVGGLVCVYCSETAHLRFWEMENGTWGRRLTLMFVYLSIIELVFSAVVVVVIVVVVVVVVVVVIHLMPI